MGACGHATMVVAALHEQTWSSTESLTGVMATAKGTVKKVPIDQFSRPRTSGLIALELEQEDTLIGTAITSGEDNVVLLTSAGKAIRFKESDIRPMGRTARGVRGIRIAEDQQMISLVIEKPGTQLLTASEKGYGKRTSITDFPVQGRGGQGVIAMVVNERNGAMVGAVQVEETDEIMLISDQGTLVRTRVDEISILGRNTQGVVLIKVAKTEKLVGIEQLQAVEGEDDEVEDSEESAVSAEGSPEGDTEGESGDDSASDSSKPSE